MSDMFPKTSKTSEPQNESPNNPLPPCSWSSNMQTYITPQSTSAGFCSYPSGMLSQGSSAMSFSEKLLRVYGGKNLDSIEKSDENLQPKRLATNECEENVKRDSTPEINCAASETGGSQHEHHDANSGYRSTKKVLQQETEELRKRVENLRDEVSELRKELLGISEQSEEVQKENESLMQELVEKYGEESIADLINKKPAAP
ncbi:hypothetical protein TanjilG_03380 [Lupinus angustifolius]|uniref:BZIP domain-containing protein n=1 Tax=Lupinus angustifolius TaxID=3871 RepID=A0A4P1RE28_LUPAN|nr:hypothetical protein TanjilG_03380 [Lupinus angustifolius]